MTLLVTNGTVYLDHRFRKADLLISENYTSVFDAGKADAAAADRVIDCNGKYILPGFADVHVHFREPGFSYKETVLTGTLAAHGVLDVFGCGAHAHIAVAVAYRHAIRTACHGSTRAAPDDMDSGTHTVVGYEIRSVVAVVGGCVGGAAGTAFFGVIAGAARE